VEEKGFDRSRKQTTVSIKKNLENISLKLSKHEKRFRQTLPLLKKLCMVEVFSSAA